MERAQKSHTELYRLGKNTLTALGYEDELLGPIVRPHADVLGPGFDFGKMVEPFSLLFFRVSLANVFSPHYFEQCSSLCATIYCNNNPANKLH